MKTSKTGFIWQEIYAWHNTGNATGDLPSGGYLQPYEHYENPETKRRINGLLEVSGIKKHLFIIDEVCSATKEDIMLFHTEKYINSIIAQNKTGGDAGDLTPFGPGSYEIALKSVGGCIDAGIAIMDRKIKNAYVLNRPPGHHAESEIGRGFCIFGNGVITAMKLRQLYNLKKIAIVDWDAHHGNGTQKGFYNDPNTLVMSIHQNQCYPLDSGFIEENGIEAGIGYNINIPLPPGSGHEAYLYTMKKVIIPALNKFQPELIIVLSGFDANAFDPLARQMAHSETFRTMTKQIMDAAENLCDGKLLMIHEGGYSQSYAPFCGLAVIECLSGHKTLVDDPFLPTLSNFGMQNLLAHQKKIILKSAILINNIK
jgi:acetoin utilization deacetylase AcuC-like enzyme